MLCSRDTGNVNDSIGVLKSGGKRIGFKRCRNELHGKGLQPAGAGLRPKKTPYMKTPAEKLFNGMTADKTVSPGNDNDWNGELLGSLH